MDNKGLWYITIHGAFVMLLFMPAISLYPLDDARLLWWFRWTGGSSGSSLHPVGMLLGGALMGFIGTWKDRMETLLL